MAKNGVSLRFISIIDMSSSIPMLTFYITHRLSGTIDADLILVMDHGRLVQAGKHRDLMAQDGKYRELYSMQASGYEVK